MAKFNEKVLCLFHKDYKQLKKEAERRGMMYDGEEKTIAKIIWKDAYDAGFTEGKMVGGAVRTCPMNCRGNMKPEAREYCLYDIGENTKYRLELTDVQTRVIEWLIDCNLLTDMELTDWENPFEDIGRI